MLSADNTVLVIIDVQGKLAHLMHKKEELFLNLRKIIQGARVLEIPVLWVEQNPDGLGPTVPEVAEPLSGLKPIPKFSFSSCGCGDFMRALRALNRKQVLAAGIEAHVCVTQTVLDLLNDGYEVQVVAEAVSSRSAENRQLGLDRCRDAGAQLTGVEMALFELLKEAKGPRFKEILKIVR